MSSNEKDAQVVLIACGSPILCGVYDELSLKRSFFSEEKTSDALTDIYQKLLVYLKEKDLRFGTVYYAKGPGNFTSLKLTHIFLHTLSVTKGIKLFSIDSFYFNKNTPIKAFGNKFFIKKSNGSIELKEYAEFNDNNDEKKIQQSSFFLPHHLNPDDFSTQNIPLYVLPPL